MFGLNGVALYGFYRNNRLVHMNINNIDIATPDRTEMHFFFNYSYTDCYYQ